MRCRLPDPGRGRPQGPLPHGTPALDLDTEHGTGTGHQTLCFVEQTSHDMRIGWYTDTYRKTELGWRLQTRKMTFLRRNGARDSGRPHDPARPLPSSSDHQGTTDEAARRGAR